MEDKKYTITLADGTVLGNLGLNGNNYISETEIDAEIFENNCCPVVISDGVNEEFHPDMELVQITDAPFGSGYWFILRDISNSELAQIKMQSDIEYVAMMAGIEL